MMSRLPVPPTPPRSVIHAAVQHGVFLVLQRGMTPRQAARVARAGSDCLSLEGLTRLIAREVGV